MQTLEERVASMPYTKTIRLGLVCLAATFTMLLAVCSASASTIAKLRVEGVGTTLDYGTSYATGTESILRGTDLGCKPAPNPVGIAGPTAMGILGSADDYTAALRPVRAAEDEFGIRVCQIGGLVETDTPFTGWLYRVNHVAPTESAALRGLSGGEEVLWYFANFSAGVNSGDELVLSAPARAVPGAFQVSVRAIDFEGKDSPAPDGTVVSGGDAEVTTTDGVATVTASQPGEISLRAAHGDEIPSNVQEVCINSDLSQCPANRGELIIGTNARDQLPGTVGPDVIKGRNGRDRINTRGGGRDKVNCGKGRDRAKVGRKDVARRCERVKRK
jgi:hypothetical protein